MKFDPHVDQRLAKLPPRSRQFYDAAIAEAESSNAFSVLERLRKDQEDSTLSYEIRPGLDLAVSALQGSLSNSDGRFLDDDAALADLRGRMAAAKENGNKPLYDSMKAALSHIETKAEAAAETHTKHVAELAKAAEVIKRGNHDRYQAMLTDLRDKELLSFQMQGMSPSQSQTHYEQNRRTDLEALCARATGHVLVTDFPAE
jgi:hypothetical protein